MSKYFDDYKLDDIVTSRTRTITEFETQVINQRNDPVVVYQDRVLVRRRPQ
jgi:hypothetical protein